MVVVYAVTIFVGAFLLFLVQPLIAKFILPWFGGSAAVWTTCMLFFQLLLLGGYAYAHGMLRLRAGVQVAVHVGLLAVALGMLPIVPSEWWKPVASGADPTWRILALLGVSVGLPYLLVAATGPLLQAWLARGVLDSGTSDRVASGGRNASTRRREAEKNVCPTEDKDFCLTENENACPIKDKDFYPTADGDVGAVASPYRLYALSNLASLGALLCYPVVIEPVVNRRGQAVGWSWGFVVFAVMSAACAVMFRRRRREGGTAAVEHEGGGASAVSIFARVLWVLLPACGTLLLLATTNKICQEVAVIPFLWIAPLAVYLLTFVIAFDSPRWYRRGVMLTLLPLAVGGVAFLLFRENGLPLAVQLGGYCGALFVCCLICHGEVARLKPPAARLTGYYLALSAGGAVGGVFVAVVAPLVFVTYFEFPLSLLLTVALALTIVFTDRNSKLYNGRPNWAWLGLIVMYMLLGYLLLSGHAGEPGRVVAASRSFYGTINVVSHEVDGPRSHTYMLRHGGITHGVQFASPGRRDEPTTYYGRTSGVGLALERFMAGGTPRRIGAVGLGAGTLAVYGRPGDVMRFYEINPHVVAYAREYFTFLKDSAAAIETVPGDARLSLEREGADQRFDVLILDAFNGDAIPVHLLTREAFDLYRRHVRAGGLIAVHITNHHLDLRPVVRGAAEHLGLHWRVVSDEHTKPGSGQYSSDWVLVCADEAFLRSLPVSGDQSGNEGSSFGARLWTDDSASLFPILK